MPFERKAVRSPVRSSIPLGVVFPLRHIERARQERFRTRSEEMVPTDILSPGVGILGKPDRTYFPQAPLQFRPPLPPRYSSTPLLYPPPATCPPEPIPRP